MKYKITRYITVFVVIVCFFLFPGSGRKYQVYVIHTSKACNILSKYTAFVPIDLDTNEYLPTSVECINVGKLHDSNSPD